MAIEQLERRTVHEGKVVRLYVDRVRYPSGSEAELEVIEHQGACAMVPLTANGTVVLVRQFRYATGEWLLEVPAGKLDPGEAPAECARREVEEEIGRRPGELVDLGWIWTTPGFTNERIWLYLARDLQQSQQQLEDGEVLDLVEMPLTEAVQLALSGEMHDSKSVCALLRAERFLRDAGS